jgi:DNA-binding NarL/FixJ family response regulator
MAKSIKVLIAEDHDVVREGLKILIKSDPEIEIAGEADNGHAAVRLAKKLQPDVVLMDLAMPRANGLDAARDIQLHSPASKVLVLSAYKDEDTIQKVLDAGVSGYMTKHSAADELLTAIREVGKGNRYYSSAIAKKLKQRERNSFRAGHAPSPASRKLTPREWEVLGLIARGQPNKEIAFTLKVSIKTVEKHRQAAMDKLDIHDVAGLTRYALTKGLVSLSGAAESKATELPWVAPPSVTETP